MDESNKLIKTYKINFSEENRLRKYSKNENISSLHKKAYLKNNNTCFNKSNLTKDINATNNIGSLYYNNLFLINHKIITPVKIQKDDSSSKFLPILVNEKIKNYKDQLFPKTLALNHF